MGYQPSRKRLTGKQLHQISQKSTPKKYGQLLSRHSKKKYKKSPK